MRRLDRSADASLVCGREPGRSAPVLGIDRMVEGVLYLVSSFWLGAVHAATPGHGKTIAASYIVGVRGRPVDALAQTRPSLAILLGLGIAGGLLPDPGALAILLAAISSGKLVLGLFTVVVFSVGFASVLVVVGVVAARVGQLVLAWLSSRRIAWVQIGAALLIVGVGLVLTANAPRTITALR